MQRARTAFVVHQSESSRRILRRNLEDAVKRVSEFSSAEKFLALSEQQMLAGCCMILDVQLPGISGLGLQEILNRHRMGPPLIFFSVVAETRFVIQAMKGGALDFITESIGEEDVRARLAQAIDLAIPLHADRAVAQDFETRMASLTPGELRFLRLLLDGQTPKEIADQMEICLATVTRRRKETLQKLGAANLIDLARKDWLRERVWPAHRRSIDSAPHFPRARAASGVES